MWAGNQSDDCPNDSKLMDHTGKPDAGNPLVRFDEGNGSRREQSHLYSTLLYFFSISYVPVEEELVSLYIQH